MKKILFICHGNICRSPMAEFIFLDLIKKDPVLKNCGIEAASAATSTEEIGNGVYPPAKRILASHGIGCGGKRARQIRPDDYANYDLLIGMDRANLRNMRNVFRGDPEGKCSMLLSHLPASHLDHGRDVADPWYTDDFQAAWDDIYLGCKALLEEIRKSVS